jgi:fructokinase
MRASTSSTDDVTTPRFLVAGEALVDVVVPTSGVPEHAPGGSPLNVAVGLARLGFDTTLLTEFGDDELGHGLLEHVGRSGVRLAEGSLVPGQRTSTATATIDEQGAATYDFDLTWDLRTQRIPDGVTALHVGSIGAAVRPGRDSVVALVEEAALGGLLVSFDPNARPVFTPDRDQAWHDVRQVAAASTVVKLSDEDLDFLQPGSDATEVATSLVGGRTRLVVVTFGGEGALAMTPQSSVRVVSRATQVVDTVGAGDSFMAALLAVVAEHGLDDLDERRLTTYVGAAHEAASVTVSRRGANPPRREELSAGWPHLD